MSLILRKLNLGSSKNRILLIKRIMHTLAHDGDCPTSVLQHAAHGWEDVRLVLERRDLHIHTGLLQFLAKGLALLAQDVQTGHDDDGRRQRRPVARPAQRARLRMGPVGLVGQVVVAEPHHQVCRERGRILEITPACAVFHRLGVVGDGNVEQLRLDGRSAPARGALGHDGGEVGARRASPDGEVVHIDVEPGFAFRDDPE